MHDLKQLIYLNGLNFRYAPVEFTHDISQSAGFDWFFYICDVTVPSIF